MKIFSSLVVFCAVLFLVFTQFTGGRPKLIRPSSTVVALFGEDAVLPCHLEPAGDAVSLMVEWARPHMNPRFVHVRRDNVDLLVDQNPSYVGRTSVSADKLKCGDVSLRLSGVKLSDNGTYRCFIPEMNQDSTVRLLVGAVSIPVISITKDGGSVMLTCSSAGWYPEPEVLWLDGEGNLLSAGPTETVRGPDDLYTVSSRVTVEKRHSNSFTCRVQQKDTSQTREAQIDVSDAAFKAPVYLTVSLSIVSVLCIMSIITVVFILWKYRLINFSFCHFAKTKTDRGQKMGEEPGRDGENNRLIDDTVDGLSNKNINDVIKTLESLRTDLKSQREKLDSRLAALRTQLQENQKKMQKTPAFITETKQMKRENFTKDLQRREREDSQLLQNTEKQLETVKDTIRKMTEMKKRPKKVKTKRDQNNLQTGDVPPGEQDSPPD